MWFLINLNSRNKRIMAAVVLLVIIVLGYEYWRWHPRHGTVSFFPQYALTLKDYSGTAVALSSYKREPLVVHTWASWCVYCGDELKHLDALKKKYGDKIEIVAPNRAESLIDAKGFTDSLGLSGSVTLLLDQNDVFYKSIQGYAMPETLFVNDHGEVVFHQRGPMSEAEADEKISELLR